MYAHANLRLCWPHIQNYWKSHVAAHFIVENCNFDGLNLFDVIFKLYREGQVSMLALAQNVFREKRYEPQYVISNNVSF